MSKIEVIKGEIFNDYRGRICSMNHFRFGEVERYYFIHHLDTDVIRGWHGHQFEKKWFQCVKGAFTLAFVEIDDWDNPSKDLKAEIFHLSESESQIICLPMGYANCIKATQKDSVLMVFSGKRVPEAYEDSWRYEADNWVDWSKY
ncbi:WxcM-like domain-containing protein [Flavobacterium gilvum]|uniref:dTDP-6-deoxy-3,4-keto-hexulose isomerase n=1 Tax=Flavobacterium gilvum TaxID=1492737 RepID=A0AAC9I6I1_9FLAO|nr:WxcM-like domain-containing protein [Flavobacterium gilvum]AOW10266.1 dTDP-6-deoxy-3,4-keto-hexulose isomerase [Flavobacterium gilvum]KFC59491.1 dTDP-6-deoxy-3,4-keto-hexulose isomerase [Flavobacterium gilvum]